VLAVLVLEAGGGEASKDGRKLILMNVTSHSVHHADSKKEGVEGHEAGAEGRSPRHPSSKPTTSYRPRIHPAGGDDEAADEGGRQESQSVTTKRKTKVVLQAGRQ
jgi:hypothetical protein